MALTILGSSRHRSVRTEARKVHDLFFDILKIAFPDTDFRDARNAISFSGPGAASTSGPSARQLPVGLSKRHKLINDVEPDPSPPLKTLSRAPIHTGEDTKTRGHLLQKESRLGGGSSNRDQVQHDDSTLLTHPGELVICKKKRKDREKIAVKPKIGLTGPVSPPRMKPTLRRQGSGSIPKELRSTQQTTHQQAWPNQPSQQVNGSGGNVGWANPVKRMRTDAGKRRPSHL